MSRAKAGMVWLALLALLFAAPMALAQDTETTPAIEVEVQDEAYADGLVTVTRVYSDGPGWLVVHADNEGAPGAILGYTALEDGENLDVTVEVDTELMDDAADTLWLMLHSDLGVEGTFEFPGADVPVQVNGETVLVSIPVLVARAQPTAQATTEATAQPTVQAQPTTATDADTQPETLPTTGASATPWLPLVLLVLGVAVVAGSALIMRRQIHIDRTGKD